MKPTTFTPPHFFLSCILAGLSLSAFSQTLINKVWEERTGHPVYNIDYMATARNGNYIYLVGSTYHLGEQENFLMTKYTLTGTKVWEKEWNGTTLNRDFGISADVRGDYVYVSGFSWDSLSNNADMITLKLTADSGNLVWSKQYGGSFGGYDIAAEIKVDDSGSVYVAGTEQTGSLDFAMTVLKYDSSGTPLWTAHYDSLNFYDGVVSLVVNPGRVSAFGFSGSGFGSWDIVTLQLNSASGAPTGVSRSPNPNGGFSQPVAVTEDYAGNTYLLATIALSPTNNDIKLIKYDSAFVEQWVRTYGCADSLDDQPAALAVDATGRVLVTGFTSRSNGATDLLTLRYDKNGTLLWSRTISAPDPGKDAKGSDIKAEQTANGYIYVTGKMDQSDGWFDYLTASYDLNGHLRWLKTFNDTTGSDDKAIDLVLDDAYNVYVSGICSQGTTASYVTVKYEQLDLSSDYETDTATDRPLYVKNQIIIKLDSAAVKREAIDNMDNKFWSMQDVLQSWAIDSLQSKLPWSYRQCKLGRVFNRLKTTDTISISRLGERVPIPDFWSTFILTFPANEVTEQELCDTLNQLFPFVEDAELDVLAELSSAAPNDYYYENHPPTQNSLHPTVYPYADINVEEAWAYTTGKPYIKVGIFDSGLMLTHHDFYRAFDNTTLTFSNSAIEGNWSYIYDSPLGVLHPPDEGGHGTGMAGIIGAVRNNSRGVAGIAGGDSATSPGVSLFPFALFTYYTFCSGCNSVASSHNLINGLFEASTQTPDSSYGYGVQLINNSYRFNLYQLYVDSGYFIDSTWSLITDAYHYVNRNKVTMPAAAGNTGDPYIDVPASLDDNWMLAVGGTGYGGNYDGDDPLDTDPVSWGEGLDISAPAEGGLIYTTHDDPVYNTQENYGYSDGTSAATAHVSGVSALLLSYLNDSTATYRNLAPEDVEYIIQRSAFNVDTPGYDLKTGYGRLNAGGALSIVDTAKRKFFHFDSDSLSHTTSVSSVSANQDIFLKEKARSAAGMLFDHKFYKADIYKVTCSISLPLSASDSIVACWERPSSSFTYGYDSTNILIPHEKIRIESISQTGAVVSGYVYHLYDSATLAPIGWLPFDTTGAYNTNFAISALTGDSIESPWDSITSSAPLLHTPYTSLRVYPNPSHDVALIEVSSNCPGECRLVLYDMQGKAIKSIYEGAAENEPRRFMLQTGNFVPGVYFISFLSACENQSLKLIKF